VGEFAREMTELLKGEQPGLGAEKLERFGQAVFKARALEMEATDPEAAALIWERMARLEMKAGDQALAARKLKLLEERAAKAAAAETALRDPALTPEAISAKLKDIFGISR
jgi:hypothetical protein